MYDVVIIGGGVSGLGAAITLGSSEGTKIGTLKTLVLDNGKSDLLKSKLYNVPYLSQGTPGKEALKKLKEDALQYKSVEFIENKVATAISGEYGNFTVTTADASTYNCRFVVIASGCHELSIQLNDQPIPTQPHSLLPREGKICVQTSNRQELKKGIYIAGLLSGITSMYAIALGSGVEAACAIMSKIANKVAIVHDYEGSR